MSETSILKNIISIIKVKRSIVICLSILLAGFFYIYDPFSEPTITISPVSNFFDLELPKEFKECRLTFKKEIDISEYSMSLDFARGSKEGIGKVSSISRENVNQLVTTLKVNNLSADDKSINEDTDKRIIRIRVLFDSSTPLEITSVFIDDKLQDIETFYLNNFFSTSKKINKYKYIRSDISNVLLKYNDPLSNIILTILAISLIPLCYEIFRKSYRCYVAGNMESYLKSEFNLSDEEAIKHAAISYGENHERSESLYRFLQLMGPAIGFTLTISSLIAGLHPSLQEVRNVKIFFETIQVAMVSTFLGLLIRIMAITLQRIDNKLLILTDDTLFKIKEGITDHNSA